MNLDTARTAVIQALGRMKSLYNQPVFDEWVLVKLARESGAVLAYDGPRADTYQARFKSDIAPLQAEMEARRMAVGDFEFIHGADGTHFDACVRLGPASYLFCNHTTKTMDEIRQDRLWLEAQKPFAELGAKFRDDPLA